MLMTTKDGRVVTYRDPLIVWLCKIAWQTKTITSPLLHYHNTDSLQIGQARNLTWGAPIHGPW